MVEGDSPGMKNVRIDFEPYEGNVEEFTTRYQKMSCHIIFDVNMEDNLSRKYRIVSGGHKTVKISSLTYSPVVYRYSVMLALTIAELNYLKVLACDIHNA